MGVEFQRNFEISKKFLNFSEILAKFRPFPSEMTKEILAFSRRNTGQPQAAAVCSDAHGPGGDSADRAGHGECVVGVGTRETVSLQAQVRRMPRPGLIRADGRGSAFTARIMRANARWGRAKGVGTVDRAACTGGLRG